MAASGAASQQLLSHAAVAAGAFALGGICCQSRQQQPHQETAPSRPATGGGGVICAGHACIDVVMERCDELSSREGYADVERFRLTPGGAVSNTAMQLAALGVPVEAMTVLGDDDFGQLLCEAWRKAGVGTRFVQLTDKAPTSCAALPVYKSDSKRAVYACPGSNATITGDMLLPQTSAGLPQHDCLAAHKFFVLGYPHIMPKLQGSSLRAFLTTVAQHTAVALDVNEAFDDPGLPLGRQQGQSSSEEGAFKPFAPVAVLHCNLEEAAACLNRKAVLMAKAAAASGVPAAEVNLEAWIEV
jgi:sugar/nucleoside kinase (ribokinase family)